MNLWNIINRLKNLKRKGWMRYGINEVESVADHSFSTAMLCYVFAKRFKVNREKAVEMALLHDLAEAIIGDITPYDSNSKEKGKLEKEAEKKLVYFVGKDGIELIKRYRSRKTKLSKFVRDMNLVDMVLQSYEYGVQNDFELYAKDRMSRKARALLVEFLGKSR